MSVTPEDAAAEKRRMFELARRFKRGGNKKERFTAGMLLMKNRRRRANISTVTRGSTVPVKGDK